MDRIEQIDTRHDLLIKKVNAPAMTRRSSHSVHALHDLPCDRARFLINRNQVHFIHLVVTGHHFLTTSLLRSCRMSDARVGGGYEVRGAMQCGAGSCRFARGRAICCESGVLG